MFGKGVFPAVEARLSLSRLQQIKLIPCGASMLPEVLNVFSQ